MKSRVGITLVAICLALGMGILHCDWRPDPPHAYEVGLSCRIISVMPEMPAMRPEFNSIRTVIG